MREQKPEKSFFQKLNAISVLLTERGTASIEINGIKYDLYLHIIIDITDLQVFRDLIFSEGYLGYHLLITKQFYEEVFMSIKHLTQRGFVSKRINPVDQMAEEDSDLLISIIKRIIWQIGREGHIWHRRLIKNEIRTFFMEVGNVVVKNIENTDDGLDTMSEADMIFFKFNRLLQDNSNGRRTVEFYANKLCVAPSYFSKVIKSHTGRNVSDWINNALLTQAKLHLRDPELSIQQIADLLNFSDQSAFGKFFKKQTGQSPREYRG